MDRLPRLRSARAPLLFGVLCCLALLALGSGQWFAAPVSAQRGTVPTRTPTVLPPTPVAATPAPTSAPATPMPATPAPATPAPAPSGPVTGAASDFPVVAPAEVLPAVGAMVEAAALP